jgi:hypothetical protein
LRGADESAITLVTRNGGTTVAVRRKSWTSGTLHTLLLIPKKPLAPTSGYLVMMAGNKKRPVLAGFTAGTSTDDLPPTWNGVIGTRYIVERSGGGDCRSGVPYVLVDFADGSSAVKDDQTPATDVAFAVWPATGPLDNETLIAIVPSAGSLTMLGENTFCAPSNFALQSTTATKFRMAPIDNAGNIGTPAEITIDPTKPEKRTR